MNSTYSSNLRRAALGLSTVLLLSACGGEGGPVVGADSSASVRAADPGGPAAPQGLVVKALGADSLSLEWAASGRAEDISHYEVLRDGLAVGTSQTPQFKYSDLSPETEYQLSVVAVNTAGKRSAPSAAVRARTTAAAPEARMLLVESFDAASLPSARPLAVKLPDSLSLQSNEVKLDLVADPDSSAGNGGKSLRAQFPAMNGSTTFAPTASFDLRPYDTDHVYIRFRAKMPKATHGLKFVKVFGQREGESYANTTFGLDYSGVDTGLGSLYNVSFGDGGTLSNDSGSIILLGGGASVGRSAGLPDTRIETPQQRAFSAPEWGTSWHLFELYVRFNSGDSLYNERNDGELKLRIDGATYVDATGLFNRHYQNARIDRVEFLGLTQAPIGARSAEFEIWYDDIEISLNNWAPKVAASRPAP